MTLSEAVGLVIRTRREQMGMTQSHLASSLGLTQGSASRLERGVSPFTVSQLELVSTLLNLEVSKLLRDAEDIVGLEHPQVSYKERQRLVVQTLKKADRRKRA